MSKTNRFGLIATILVVAFFELLPHAATAQTVIPPLDLAYQPRGTLAPLSTIRRGCAATQNNINYPGSVAAGDNCTGTGAITCLGSTAFSDYAYVLIAQGVTDGLSTTTATAQTDIIMRS